MQTISKESFRKLKAVDKKKLLISVIESIKAQGDYSYVLVGETIGVSKERVRQLIKEYNLEDFNQSRNDVAKVKIQNLIDNNQFSKKSVDKLPFKVLKRVNKDYLDELATNQGIELLNRRKSKIVHGIKLAEKNGFFVKDHTIRENFDYLTDNGFIEVKMNHFHNEILRNNIEYKKTLNRAINTKKQQAYNELKALNIDFKSRILTKLHKELYDKELLSYDYKVFYNRLRRYGFI